MDSFDCETLKDALETAHAVTGLSKIHTFPSEALYKHGEKVTELDGPRGTAIVSRGYMYGWIVTFDHKGYPGIKHSVGDRVMLMSGEYRTKVGVITLIIGDGAYVKLTMNKKVISAPLKHLMHL